MNRTSIKNRLTEAVLNKAEDVLTEKAKTLSALIKYEISVVNTELAMQSSDHGYNFKFIPESYADNVMFHPVKTEGASLTLTLSIPSAAFSHASKEEIEFFKTFVLKNAMLKLQRGS